MAIAADGTPNNPGYRHFCLGGAYEAEFLVALPDEVGILEHAVVVALGAAHIAGTEAELQLPVGCQGRGVAIGQSEAGVFALPSLVVVVGVPLHVVLATGTVNAKEVAVEHGAAGMAAAVQPVAQLAAHHEHLGGAVALVGTVPTVPRRPPLGHDAPAAGAEGHLHLEVGRKGGIKEQIGLQGQQGSPEGQLLSDVRPVGTVVHVAQGVGECGRMAAVALRGVVYSVVSITQLGEATLGDDGHVGGEEDLHLVQLGIRLHGHVVDDGQQLLAVGQR